MKIEPVEKTSLKDCTCIECQKRKSTCCISIGGNMFQLCNDCKRLLLTSIINYNAKHHKKEEKKENPYSGLADIFPDM